jgi:hypothetical protein
VSDVSAVLLDTTARIRFVPAANYNGSAGNITFRAWDQTSGASGDTAVDVSTNGGTTAYSTATETATLTVTPVNDTPTAIAPNSFNIDENTDTTGGVSVGTLATTDPDTGETLTYSIQGGADAANFTIGGAGSDELILDDGVLDFEAKSSYTVVVRVTDSGGLTHDETITVNVDNLNEAPTAISPTSFNINENTDTTGGVSVDIARLSAAPGRSFAGICWTILKLDCGNYHVRGQWRH